MKKYGKDLKKARNRKENNMDAVKFMKEKKRMCRAYNLCSECPVAVKLGSVCKLTLEENYEELVKIVENWSRENPKYVGKKYIIEIDRATHTSGGDLFYIKGTDGYLENKELDKLEEYRKTTEHDACKYCKYEDKTEIEEPCVRCRYAYRDKWESKE